MIKPRRLIQVEDHINGLRILFLSFYKYNDKLLTSISYDLLVNGINRMPIKTRGTLGNKLMNFYCALEQRYSSTVRLVLENINGTESNNNQQISRKWIQLWNQQLWPDPKNKILFFLLMITRVISRNMTK